MGVDKKKAIYWVTLMRALNINVAQALPKVALYFFVEHLVLTLHAFSRNRW